MAFYEPPPGERDGFVWICRPWVTRGGKRVYASQYGKRAFCFWVPVQTPI